VWLVVSLSFRIAFSVESCIMNITTARSRSGIRLAPAARLITTLLHEMEQQDAR